MSSNQRVTTIKQATISMMGQIITVSNLVIDKLSDIKIEPLTSEKTKHQIRYVLHAFVKDKTKPELTNSEIPKIDITNQEDGNQHVLSQAIIIYYSNDELKIGGTFFK